MKKFPPLTKRIAALMLAASMLFMSSCGSKDNSSSSTPSSDSSSSSSSMVGEPAPEPVHLDPVKPAQDVLDKLNEKIAINEDVVGWLRVPDTEIDEHVLQKTDWDVSKNGEYYERKDINGQYDWFGSYFADYESTVGDRNEMSNIVTIYGHSMNDNIDSDKFSKLKRYKDQKFAEEHPYFYLTTPTDDMVFKVFGVIYTDWKYLPYYYPDEKSLKEAKKTQKYLKIDTLQGVIDEMKARSLFDFDVEVDSSDKLVVLSTCTYLYGKTQEEQEQYRFLVVGRLVRPGEDTSAATVKAEENKDVKKATEP